MRLRSTVMVTTIVIVIVLYVVCYRDGDFSLGSAAQPHCQFADHLTAFAASGLPRGTPSTASTPPPASAVTGQATVFYVWCGARRRPFEFRHYLSVRSALRTLQPDNVWFYYESQPIIDKALYNTWWDELIDDVPFFHRRSLGDVGSGGRLPLNACDGPGRPSVDFVYELVTSRGGTFVDELTVVAARPLDDELTVALDVDDRSELKPNTHRRRDSTRQLRRVGVGGMHSALAFNTS